MQLAKIVARMKNSNGLLVKALVKENTVENVNIWLPI